MLQKLEVRGAPPQCLEFHADLAELASHIPTPAHFEELGIVPSPTWQWFARIGDRMIIVEQEKETHTADERVFVHTSYLPNQDELGDWASLLDLRELPRAIHVTRPRYIVSRTLEPEHVVFRPDELGANIPVYNASSRRDAGGLLAFLKQDRFNARCFIGPPSLPGAPAVLSL